MANSKTERQRQIWRDTVLVPAHKAGRKLENPPRQSPKHKYHLVTKAAKHGGF